MPRMTGAQALIAQLRSEGVDTVFGLPGVQIMDAFDALHEQRNAIRLIHTRHEQATTYMADGYAKVTGAVGVAMVVPGPGALNAASGLITAYASSSPVLLISGQTPTSTLGRGLGELHEVEEQLDVFRPLTKWNHRVTRPAEIPETVHEAFRQLKTGRPRPVELEVPPDTLAGSDEVRIRDPEDVPAADGDDVALEAAARRLVEARRPVVVAGGGATIAGASKSLVALAEFLQMPVMTTAEGKGLIADKHPLHLGAHYCLGPVESLVEGSDLLLAVGTRLDLDPLAPERLPGIVQIDIDPGEIGRRHPAELGIVADADCTLSALLTRIETMTEPRAPRADEVARSRQAFRDGIRKIAPEQTAIVDVLGEVLDDEAIVVSGVTNIGYWSSIMLPVHEPRTYVTSSYAGTLGYAFPTALGAKVARPHQTVVALCGDGGFMYSPQELATARQHGINLVAVVFNNHAFGASRWDQIHRFGERFIGTVLRNPDFGKLADAFGVTGMRTDPDGLGESLAAAVAMERPVVLEVELPVMMPPFQVV